MHAVQASSLAAAEEVSGGRVVAARSGFWTGSAFGRFIPTCDQRCFLLVLFFLQ